MHAEGELRNNLDDSEKVRELQDKVAELKAEVCGIQRLILFLVSTEAVSRNIAVRGEFYIYFIVIKKLYLFTVYIIYNLCYI